MSSSDFKIVTVSTKPFDGQKPGTSGLRKKVTEVKQAHYLENFVQSIWDSLPQGSLKGATLVVAGDGRYYNTEATVLIIRMAAAQGISKIVTGVNGLMSTPCVSGVIRGIKAYGGIILTASHNPGGPTEDFGIKYNAGNGGPAPESLTDIMFAKTKTITQYQIAESTPVLDFSRVGSTSFGPLTIEVIDAALAYSQLMRSIFDFDALSKFVKRSDFKFIYDSMHGVAGPFATQIFIKDLGASPDSLLNADPKVDFGGGHPDPNLTYAADLVYRLGLATDIKMDHGDDDHGHAHGGHGHSHGHGGHGHAHGPIKESDIPDFGAAADGDADRNMILGRKFFVTPSDSVAIIAANHAFIPYFKNGLKGVARSMPTSAALDRVAQKIGVKCYEVPTGWKFFGNLMDANQLSICGEESFGTGSDHIREKDGMWAVLCWLSILEGKNRNSKQGHLVSVKDIVTEHWKIYGRNYYSRYDYEGVDSTAANKVMSHLIDLIPKIESKELTKLGDYAIAKLDEFTYNDPVDKSVSAHQGIRLIFTDGSRIVYRLSGTGSVGATIRIYIEKYESDPHKLEQVTATALEPLISIALSVSKIHEFTGRNAPTVIT